MKFFGKSFQHGITGNEVTVTALTARQTATGTYSRVFRVRHLPCSEIAILYSQKQKPPTASSFETRKSLLSRSSYARPRNASRMKHGACGPDLSARGFSIPSRRADSKWRRDTISSRTCGCSPQSTSRWVEVSPAVELLDEDRGSFPRPPSTQQALAEQLRGLGERSYPSVDKGSPGKAFPSGLYISLSLSVSAVNPPPTVHRRCYCMADLHVPYWVNWPQLTAVNCEPARATIEVPPSIQRVGSRALADRELGTYSAGRTGGHARQCRSL